MNRPKKEQNKHFSLLNSFPSLHSTTATRLKAETNNLARNKEKHYQTLSSKKLEFQFAVWTSSSQILLALSLFGWQTTCLGPCPLDT